jgi:pilus assembly protein CpaB
MRAARIVVLAVALGAGGIAADLASGSTAGSAPAVQIDTVDILVARADIATAREDDGTNRRLDMVRFRISTTATTK